MRRPELGLYGWRSVVFKRFFSTHIGVGGGEGGWFQPYWLGGEEGHSSQNEAKAEGDRDDSDRADEWPTGVSTPQTKGGGRVSGDARGLPWGRSRD